MNETANPEKRSILRLAEPAITSVRTRAGDAAFATRALAITTGTAIWRASMEVKAGLGLAAFLVLLCLVPQPPQAADTFHLRTDIALETGLPIDVPFGREPWRAVPAQMTAYSLDTPDLARRAPVYRVRSYGDGARHDLLVWPSNEDAPILTGAVSIERYAGAPPRSEAHYVEIARRAALIGASIERMAQTTEMLIKFGPVDVADAQILVQSQVKPCLTFRSSDAASVLQISGWFCGSEDRPIDRATLGCLLDRIDLVSAGNDQAVRTAFAEAERRRKSCSARIGPALRAPETGRPALRTSAETRGSTGGRS